MACFVTLNQIAHVIFARKTGQTRREFGGSLDLTTVFTCMAETPKKIQTLNENCFLCTNTAVKKERVRVFGSSEENIPHIIGLALEKDINIYSNSTDVFICVKCYKRLLRFKKIRQNLADLKDEIQANK